MILRLPLLLALLFLLPGLCFGQTLNVGSKRFTESYILGEIVAQTVEQGGEVSAVHRAGRATPRLFSPR